MKSPAVIVAVYAILAFAPIASAERGPERAANQALTQGDALLRQGRHQEAIDTWRAGLRAVPHWVLMLRIGNAFRQLGRCDLALAYFNVGYAWRDDSFTQAMLPPLQAAIADCRRELPSRLEVTTDRGGATVSVDGTTVGTSPLEPVEIAAGEHAVSAERDGYASSDVTVMTRPGTTTFVRLTLAPEAPQRRDANRSPFDSPTAQAQRRRGRIWGGALLGAGLLLAGGGAALTALDIIYDGREIYDHQTISSLGPGVLLVSLAATLVAGSVALFVAHPPARAPRARTSRR